MPSRSLVAVLLLLAGCSLSVPSKYRPPGPEDVRADDAAVDVQTDVPADVPADEGPMCLGPADCQDTEPCNGEELCEGGICLAGTPLPDGTACTSPSVAGGVCRAGTCAAATCGNGVLEAGEECDDANTTPSDGCELDCRFSCHGDEDCGAGDPCVSGTCVENGIGRVCDVVYTTAPCDDGLFCTVSDACDGAGRCLGAPFPCDDGIICTVDTCVEGSGGPECQTLVQDGFCLIGETCVAEGTPNPDNACETCRPSLARTAWSIAEDMTPCNLGACCSGRCRVMAACCTDADCGAACRGEPLACSSMSGEGACSAHAGCVWGAEGSCGGGSVNCAAMTGVGWLTCTACGCGSENCRWEGADYICDCTASTSIQMCSVFEDRDFCTSCRCTWTPGPPSCSGEPTPCGEFADDVTCAGQAGCTWEHGTCSSFQCQ